MVVESAAEKCYLDTSYKNIKMWVRFVINIFQYSAVAPFLRDRFSDKKRRNRSFSLRSWAKKLGMKSHTPLHLSISGTRPLPRHYVPILARDLGLGVRETAYFECLSEFERARTPVMRRHFAERLNGIAPANEHVKKTAISLRLLEDPLHLIIREMTLLREFRDDPRWIGARLKQPRSVSDIVAARQRLLELGLVQDIDGDGEGRTIQAADQIVRTASDMQDSAMKEYHRNILDLAHESLTKDASDSREFVSYVLRIDQERVIEAKLRLRSVLEEFVQDFDCPKGEGRQVFQAGLNFFGVTKDMPTTAIMCEEKVTCTV